MISETNRSYYKRNEALKTYRNSYNLPALLHKPRTIDSLTASTASPTVALFNMAAFTRKSMKTSTVQTDDNTCELFPDVSSPVNKND